MPLGEFPRWTFHTGNYGALKRSDPMNVFQDIICIEIHHVIGIQPMTTLEDGISGSAVTVPEFQRSKIWIENRILDSRRLRGFLVRTLEDPMLKNSMIQKQEALSIPFCTTLCDDFRS